MNDRYERIGAAFIAAMAWLRRNGSPKALLRHLWQPRTFAVAYAVIGLLTFGHVAAENYRAEQYEYEACDRSRTANDRHSYNSCWRPNSGFIALHGVAAGSFWPLYLSWELQQ